MKAETLMPPALIPIDVMIAYFLFAATAVACQKLTILVSNASSRKALTGSGFACLGALLKYKAPVRAVSRAIRPRLPGNVQTVKAHRRHGLEGA